MSSVLITGGFGYIGGRVAHHLQCSGHTILLGTRQTSITPMWLLGTEVRKINWQDDIALERACHGVNVIIHAAGMNAQDCTKDPVAALEFNGMATARLARAASLAGVKLFIYLSTAHVYACPLVGIITEDSCPRNLHPYATSHLAGEQAALYVGHSGPIESVVLRLSNSVGAPMHKGVNCWSLLTNDLCRQAVERKQLTLNSAGSQQRDFVSLSEVCRIIDWFVSNERNHLQTNIFNVGAGVSSTLLDMAMAIQGRCEIVLGFRPDIILHSENDGGEDLVYRVEQLEKHGIQLDSDLTSELDNLLLFCMREFGTH